jgi:hypothetical protein
MSGSRTPQNAGHSVPVLPVESSHCWHVRGQAQPLLFRADAMQLGLSFCGKLDARLVFRLGPILGGRYRGEGLQAMQRLGIS